ncbi:MAG: hypothetical protein JRH16_20785 [Deltaproteobacteria bacterium]|nr:hypothetical protein [Deltaproteobacteria bacterium]MBW2362433.1 hypothetical protein [Deltaproteobacteria bacterium]
MSGSLRIGVIGATGALGGQVLELLSESSLDIAELLPVATERSLGSEVEFRGNTLAVETQAPKLRGLDCVFLCTPSEVSRDFVREALKLEVLCIDAGGAMAGVPEAPLRVAAFGGAGERAPLLVAPPGAALVLALALRPLEEAAGLRRVVGTCLEAASWGGREGIESLFNESIALFNQEEAPEPGIFAQPVAFDCVPALGEIDAAGVSQREFEMATSLSRLLAAEPRLALSFVQVPIFMGFGASLAVETERPLDPALAEGHLGQAPGIERWDGFADGVTLRAAAGREVALVGRVRRDPSSPENGLLLWVAADVLRLAAANAVQLAVRQLSPVH